MNTDLRSGATNRLAVGKDDFAAHLQRVFPNLGEAMKSTGGSFADVLKQNYFCVQRVERSQLGMLRSMRDRFVNTQAPPVGTSVFVSSLVNPDWLIEVEAGRKSTISVGVLA